ncbi:MAG TPA: FG-GAP-like repeat-containing protein [Vicinamibacterales bacterium]|nr:FG-GAP-like repeat-containing protein [Vicinamibacterales bacterium]
MSNRRDRRSISIAISVIAAIGLAALLNARQTAPADAPVSFRIIVVSTAEKAQQIRDRLLGGASFAALARTESSDPSADRGGLIGPVALTELREELREVLRTLDAVGVSNVIALPTGFAIVQRERSASGSSIRGSEILALSSVGSVRATVSVDGFGEANTALNSLQKPDDWNQNPRTICELRQQSVNNVKAALARRLGPDIADTRRQFSPQDVMEAYLAYGQLLAYDGEMSAAIAQFEQAYRIAQSDQPASIPDLLQSLGVAHMHKAEMDNGLYRSPGDRCLLSLQGRRGLERTEDMDKASGYFLKLLDASPRDIEAKWLVNVAHMATGGYPEQVPARYRIDASAFASSETVGRFVDIASAAGIDSFSSAGGVIVDDFDNDGRLDIFTSNFDSCGKMQLFHRTEQGTFVDRSIQAGLADQLGGLNLLQADYDNDGCRDVLVLRGGWELAQRKSLLRNNCDGTFTDITVVSGLAKPATSTQTAAWVDIDNDGWIDLFVGNEDAPAQLFRNRGDGTFEDIGVKAGVARTAFTKAVHAGDYDNDGYADLYVSNLRGTNFLYHNNRDRTFTDVAAKAGVPGADRGFPAWFFDYDNDGWDDLFVSSYFLSIEETARSYMGLPLNAQTMKLYRNQGNGTFRDVTKEANLAKAYMPMGSNFGDIDNDGFLDIFLGTGSPSYAALKPSVLLRNREGKSFVDVTVSSGTGEMHKGHGVAFADLDNDGDEEIIFKVGGATPGDAHAFRLFENPGNGNDWLEVNLVGVKTNRAAIGARITATIEDATGAMRTVHRTVNSGGSFGASPLQQHIGLGKAAKRVDLDIFWPASGTKQHFANVTKNRAIEIHEMSDRLVPLIRPPAPLGGAHAK